MSAVAAVIGRLEDVAAVTALVASRIYQGVFPQSGTFPAIRVQRISEDALVHLRGAGEMYRTRVQVDSVADGGMNAIASALAVDTAVRGNGAGTSLVGWTGDVDGVSVHAVLPVAVREQFDAEELRQYRVMRDLYVWWTT